MKIKIIYLFSVIQSGSGLQSDINQFGGVTVSTKRRRKDPSPEIEKAIKDAHVVITSDVSNRNSSSIVIPSSMVDELQVQISRMRTVKIQFGVQAEYTNVKEETKMWFTSNSSVIYNENFFVDGIEKLSKKLSKFSEQSSRWTIVKILEVQLTLIKYEEIMNRTGRRYISTPVVLTNKKCTINVKNTDDKCFLYSIAAIESYNSVTNDIRENKETYEELISELSYEEEWFPMKLNNISKFEKANNMAINILQWNEEPIKRTVHYKHPNIEIIRRTKREEPQIYH